MYRFRWFGGLILLSVVLAACSGLSGADIVSTPVPGDDSGDREADIAQDAAPGGDSATVVSPPGAADAPPTPLPGNLDSVTFIEDNREYIIRQLIPRDGIQPIYDPQFTSAAQAGYADSELVMGVEIDGDARAYPVGVLRSREIVNDVIGGTPVLVTW